MLTEPVTSWGTVLLGCVPSEAGPLVQVAAFSHQQGAGLHRWAVSFSLKPKAVRFLSLPRTSPGGPGGAFRAPPQSSQGAEKWCHLAQDRASAEASWEVRAVCVWECVCVCVCVWVCMHVCGEGRMRRSSTARVGKSSPLRILLTFTLGGAVFLL